MPAGPVLVFCRAERYFCHTRGRNRGESISAIVSAISAGEKGQNSLKPDKIVEINLSIDVNKCILYIICGPQHTIIIIILFVCSVQHIKYMYICILLIKSVS